MSQQNTPGSDPNNERDDSQSPYGSVSGAAPEASSNPYFGNTQAGPRRIWTPVHRNYARLKNNA